MYSNFDDESLNSLGLYPNNGLYEKYNLPLPNLSTSYFLSENLDNRSFSLEENETDRFQLFQSEKSFIKDAPSTNITSLNRDLPKYDPKFYNLYDIIEELKAHNINLFSKEDSILLEEVQKQVEKETLKVDQKEAQKQDYIKRKRKNKSEEKQKKENDKLGKYGDISKKVHNKFSPDNIIKKIKKILINHLINFVNINIEKNIHEGKNLIKNLSYMAYTNKLKVDTNREDLQKSVTQILSNDISGKYKKSATISNKFIIDSILKNHKNDNIIKFIFNLTMSEWIAIFLKNKNLDDFGTLEESEYNIIVIPDINDIFNKYKNDKKYLAHLIYYLYNYENYFYNKKARKSHKKKE